MIIGVPRETHRHEHRVGLSPFAVSRLVQQGHTVFVERSAGEAAHFSDRDFEEAGARIVYNPEETYKRADLVCRVGLVTSEETDLLKPGTTICAFHHLAVTSRENLERFSELEATLIGYEIIQDKSGDLPVLVPFGEMAGRMAVNLAAYYLMYESGGRGILMGNVPGVPPPTVVILGAGSVGSWAAREALSSGAHVIVLDTDLAQLRGINTELQGRAVTVVPTPSRLEQFTAIADVVVGAVLIPGARAPYLVTEEMVKKMKAGSVIIDVSIDQGGCVETSRPTTLDNPIYAVHGVLHYCVPNMTANVPRTASRALSNTALPYIGELAAKGLETALREDPGLAAGTYLFRGKLTNKSIGEAFGIPHTPMRELLGGSD